MRILFLNDLSDPRIGSSIRQMYQHAARLRELGHETALVTAVQDPAQVGETEIEGLRTFRLLSSYDPRWRAWVQPRQPAGAQLLRAHRRRLEAGHRAQPPRAHAPLLRGARRGPARRAPASCSPRTT
jgi:hypothetical protein